MKIYQKYFSGYLITIILMIVTGISVAISFTKINRSLEDIRLKGFAETKAISGSAYHIQRINSVTQRL